MLTHEQLRTKALGRKSVKTEFDEAAAEFQLLDQFLEARTRKGLTVVAENIPGVTLVRDHLVYIEPVSGTVIESPTDMQQAAKAS